MVQLCLFHVFVVVIIGPEESRVNTHPIACVCVNLKAAFGPWLLTLGSRFVAVAVALSMGKRRLKHLPYQNNQNFD